MVGFSIIKLSKVVAESASKKLFEIGKYLAQLRAKGRFASCIFFDC